jgi:hypothetical protein
MRHTTLDQLADTAELGKAAMSRQERLERWADLLGREPHRRLNTLDGTEYRTGEAQAKLRADNSPISVAYADAVLRAEGLADDTYGEARRFFELSNRELHHVLCYCHFGRTMTAEAAALRVSTFAKAGRAFDTVTRAWRSLIG